jgi:hypothetical protein
MITICGDFYQFSGTNVAIFQLFSFAKNDMRLKSRRPLHVQGGETQGVADRKKNIDIFLKNQCRATVIA